MVALVASSLLRDVVERPDASATAAAVDEGVAVLTAILGGLVVAAILAAKTMTTRRFSSGFTASVVVFVLMMIFEFVIRRPDDVAVTELSLAPLIFAPMLLPFGAAGAWIGSRGRLFGRHR